MTGWWRRNGWAVPVIVVALALTGGPEARDWIEAYRRSRPVEAVRPGADGWAGYGGGRLHVVSIERIRLPELPDDGRAALPTGTSVWRATLDVVRSTPQALLGCELFLRGASGRDYGGDSDELRFRVADASFGCTGRDEAATSYRLTPVFLVPADDVPAAVVIQQSGQLPRYAELPVRADQP